MIVNTCTYSPFDRLLLKSNNEAKALHKYTKQVSKRLRFSDFTKSKDNCMSNRLNVVIKIRRLLGAASINISLNTVSISVLYVDQHMHLASRQLHYFDVTSPGCSDVHEANRKRNTVVTPVMSNYCRSWKFIRGHIPMCNLLPVYILFIIQALAFTYYLVLTLQTIVTG